MLAHKMNRGQLLKGSNGFNRNLVHLYPVSCQPNYASTRNVCFVRALNAFSILKKQKQKKKNIPKNKKQTMPAYVDLSVGDKKI